MVSKVENKPYPVTATITTIGRRWKPIIFYHPSDHTRRFRGIAAPMPSISRKVLSEQLKELEEDGLIIRQKFKEIPLKVDYFLPE